MEVLFPLREISFRKEPTSGEMRKDKQTFSCEGILFQQVWHCCFEELPYPLDVNSSLENKGEKTQNFMRFLLNQSLTSSYLPLMLLSLHCLLISSILTSYLAQHFEYVVLVDGKLKISPFVLFLLSLSQHVFSPISFNISF